MDEQQTATSLGDLINRLPLELLPIILLYSLPPIDFSSHEDRSHTFGDHVAALYRLRAVSKEWRDLIDDSPQLWNVISSTLPDEVNNRNLLYSQSAHLIVHFVRVPKDRTPVSTFQRFLQLVLPYQHRWGAISFTVTMETLDTPLVLPSAGYYDTLNLTIRYFSNWTREVGTPTRLPAIDVPAEGLQRLTHLWLDCVRMDWPRVLPELENLKTMVIVFRGYNQATMELLLRALARSPGLEDLDLGNLDAAPLPSTTFIEPISLPRLTSLKLEGNLTCIDTLLNHIALPSDPRHNPLSTIRIELDTLVEGFDPLAAKHFWTDTVARQLVPSLRRIYAQTASAAIALSPTGRCEWKTDQDSSPRFHLYLGGMDPVSALDWMQGVIEGLEGIPPASVFLQHGAIKQRPIVDALKTFPKLKYILGVMVGSGPTDGDLRWFFEALAGGSDSADASASAIGFASLEVVRLERWRCNLSSFLAALQTRFASPRPLPELSINLISKPTTWKLTPPSPDLFENIVKFHELQAIGKIAGMGKVTLGQCTEFDGMLGMVWDEERGAPVWGS